MKNLATGWLAALRRPALGAAALALASFGASAAPVAVEPETSRVLGRELLKQLIDTNSTHAHGSTIIAKALADRFLAEGFAAADVVLLAPPDHPTKGNLVVRLRGAGHGAPILYICHLDVVEAKPEDWTFDPFKLTEKDGWLYGRGTIDMKGQDAAVATSLIRLKREGKPLARDIIVAFTADEESEGDANGVDWLLKTHRELLDGSIVINPDGGEAGMKAGRKLYIAVQTSEKVFMTLGLTATDKGGHSSRPTDSNPIYRMAAALLRVSQLKFPLHLTDTTKLYFSRRAQLEQGVVQADFRAIAAGTADAAAIGRLSADVETNIMLRTTCTATMMDGGHAENALPQRARASIQCRVIPGETAATVEATLRAQIADPSIAISTITAARPSPESAPNPALLATVEAVTHEIWPGVIVLPEMSAGASDSSYSRSAGMASYGIDGMFDDLDDGRAHGRDERISVAAFNDDLEFTYRLMKRLSSARP